MSRLYVANCTKQNMLVHYRLDFTERGTPNARGTFQPARQQDIPPGRQVQLGGDMHATQIEDIVQQLSRYGMIGVVDVPRMKTTATMVFNTDKPVPQAIIRDVMDLNAGVKIQQGKARRQRAAVAVNDIIQNKVNNEFMAAGIEDSATDQVDVTFEQLDQSEAGEKTIAEAFHVRPDTRAKGKGGSRRRKN